MELKIIFPLEINLNKLHKFLSVSIWEKCNASFKQKLKLALKLNFNSYIYYNQLKLNRVFLNTLLGEACRYQNKEMIDFAMNKGANDWRYATKMAAKGGDVEIVNFMIAKDNEVHTADNVDIWEYGLGGACLGGNVKIVDQMIEKGAKNWNAGLLYACKNGHLDIVNKMIDLGANNFDQGIYFSAINNFSEISKLMIDKKGASNPNEILYAACYKGDVKKAVNMMYVCEKFSNIGMYEACKYGHIQIIDLMIMAGAKNWNCCFEEACKYGQTNVAEIMINNGADNLKEGLVIACKGYHTDTIRMIIDKISTNAKTPHELLVIKLECITELLQDIGPLNPERYFKDLFGKKVIFA